MSMDILYKYTFSCKETEGNASRTGKDMIH